MLSRKSPELANIKRIACSCLDIKASVQGSSLGAEFEVYCDRASAPGREQGGF